MPAFADLHNRLGTHLRLECKGSKTNIGHWTDARAWVGWTFKIDRPGRYRVHVDMAAESPSNVTFGLAGCAHTETAVDATGRFDHFNLCELGEVSFDKSGIHQLEIRAVKQG